MSLVGDEMAPRNNNSRGKLVLLLLLASMAYGFYYFYSQVAAERDALSMQLSSVQENLDKTREELAEAQENFKLFQEEASDTEKKMMEEKLSALGECEAEMKTQAEKCKAAQDDLNAQLDEEKVKGNRLADEHQNAVEKHQTSLSACENKLSVLRDEKEKLEVELTKANGESSRLAQELDSQKQNGLNLQDLHSQLQTKISEKEKLAEECQDEHAKKAMSLTQCYDENLKLKLKGEENELAIKNLNIEKQSLEARLDDANNAVADLHGKIAVPTLKPMKMGELESHNAALSKQNASKDRPAKNVSDLSREQPEQARLQPVEAEPEAQDFQPRAHNRILSQLEQTPKKAGNQPVVEQEANDENVERRAVLANPVDELPREKNEASATQLAKKGKFALHKQQVEEIHAQDADHKRQSEVPEAKNQPAVDDAQEQKKKQADARVGDILKALNLEDSEASKIKIGNSQSKPATDPVGLKDEVKMREEEEQALDEFLNAKEGENNEEDEVADGKEEEGKRGDNVVWEEKQVENSHPKSDERDKANLEDHPVDPAAQDGELIDAPKEAKEDNEDEGYGEHKLDSQDEEMLGENEAGKTHPGEDEGEENFERVVEEVDGGN